MQLEDKAFTAWMQRLTEARRNRQKKVQRPYRNYHKPYNDRYDPSKESGKHKYRKYQIKQKFKPVAEIEVQPIMDTYRCMYEDIEEAIDLFNLDFEECNQAWLAKGYAPEEYLHVIAEQEEICYVNNDIQKRGTSFPIFFPESREPETRVGVPSHGHFLHVLTVFPVVIQINCHSLWVLSTYISIQLY